MRDLVLDTNVLADFLTQYFGPAERGQSPFEAGGWLSSSAVRLLNQMRRRYRADEPVKNLVIASSLAFVELVRQWDDIVQDRFQPYQLAAFLVQPPDWFSVAPVDEDLIEFFCDVPADVSTPEGIVKSIEWTDAVHIATVFSRDDECLFATTDQRLQHVARLSRRLL